MLGNHGCVYRGIVQRNKATTGYVSRGEEVHPMDATHAHAHTFPPFTFFCVFNSHYCNDPKSSCISMSIHMQSRGGGGGREGVCLLTLQPTLLPLFPHRLFASLSHFQICALVFSKKQCGRKCTSESSNNCWLTNKEHRRHGERL